MISGQLAGFAREHRRAIGKQDLGLADAPRVEQHVSRRRVARVVLVAEVEVEVTERNPTCLAAPTSLDQLAFEGQQLTEGRAPFGRALVLEASHESQVACYDLDHMVLAGLR